MSFKIFEKIRVFQSVSTISENEKKKKIFNCTGTHGIHIICQWENITELPESNMQRRTDDARLAAVKLSQN